MIEKLSEELGEKELKIMEKEKKIKSLKKDINKIAVERNYFKEVIENNDITQCEVCNIYQNEEDSIYMIEFIHYSYIHKQHLYRQILNFNNYLFLMEY